MRGPLFFCNYFNSGNLLLHAILINELADQTAFTGHFEPYFQP